MSVMKMYNEVIEQHISTLVDTLQMLLNAKLSNSKETMVEALNHSYDLINQNYAKYEDFTKALNSEFENCQWHTNSKMFDILRYDHLDNKHLKLYINAYITVWADYFDMARKQRSRQDLFSDQYKYISETQVLYSGKPNTLNFSNIMDLGKYACRIASIVDYNNPNYAKAKATISVFNAIESISRGEGFEKPTKEMFHLTVDFLLEIKKGELVSPSEKCVAITIATLIDLVVDYLLALISKY